MKHYTFDKSKFAKGDTREARAETMMFLYAVRPDLVKRLVGLQGITIDSDLEFQEFIKLYEESAIQFNSSKLFNDIVVSNADIMKARARYAPQI